MTIFTEDLLYPPPPTYAYATATGGGRHRPSPTSSGMAGDDKAAAAAANGPDSKGSAGPSGSKEASTSINSSANELELSANAILPAHIWLRIAAELTASGGTTTSRRRTAMGVMDEESRAEGLAFLHQDLRFVCRDLYRVSMTYLRDYYTSTYLSRIKNSRSSDPTGPLRRERKVLDLFIAAQVLNDLNRVQSELFEQRDVDELFDIYQPRARLEDLLGEMGAREGILHAASGAPSRTQIRPADIVITLTTKQVNLQLPFRSTSGSNSIVRRTVLSVSENLRRTPRSLEEIAREFLHRVVAEVPLLMYCEDVEEGHRRDKHPHPHPHWYEEEDEAARLHRLSLAPLPTPANSLKSGGGGGGGGRKAAAPQTQTQGHFTASEAGTSASDSHDAAGGGSGSGGGGKKNSSKNGRLSTWLGRFG